MRGKSQAYRPELHYMRGPGPKWREKNGVLEAPSVGANFQPLAMSWLIPAATAILLVVVTALAFA
jgi:hypothetical protein